MARKSYSDEFRRLAVDLYESVPGATLKDIADDLGIGRETSPPQPTVDSTLGRQQLLFSTPAP